MQTAPFIIQTASAVPLPPVRKHSLTYINVKLHTTYSTADTEPSSEYVTF